MFLDLGRVKFGSVSTIPVSLADSVPDPSRGGFRRVPLLCVLFEQTSVHLQLVQSARVKCGGFSQTNPPQQIKQEHNN